MAARSIWITGQLEYQRSRENAKPYRIHYVVNDGKLLIVEFWPPEEAKAEDRTSPSHSANTSHQSAIDVVSPKRSSPQATPEHNALLSSPLACQLPSPQEIPSPSAVSAPPPRDASRRSEPALVPTGPEVVVKREPSPEEIPFDFRRPIRLLSPPGKRRADQTIPPGPTETNPNHSISRTHESSQHKESPAQPDSLRPTSLSRTPHPLPNLKPTPLPPPSIISEGRDVADIMKLVRATNHHQVVLPSRKEPNYESSSSLRSPRPRILISDRYVISWMDGNHPDFVSRVPPRWDHPQCMHPD